MSRDVEKNVHFMQEAIRVAYEGMLKNHGGPFGCVIVRDDVIVGKGYNSVLLTNDPTAHAEVVAIRDACKNLQTFQLTDCDIYTTCEPCPMCLGAIYWARPKKIYYASTRNDAANIGFDDAFIYEELNVELEDRKIRMEFIGINESMILFKDWMTKEDKTLF